MGGTVAPEEAQIATEYRILGPLEIWRDGQLVPAGPPKQRALLGLLLLNANGVVPTVDLLEELWGPEPRPTSRASLQNHVTRLRRLLGADAIETVGGGYRLVVDDEALDLVRFERAVSAARLLEPAERAEALHSALGMWRGLPLVDSPTSPTAQSAIVQLEELRLDAVESRVDAELTLGRHAELVPELEGLVVLHPFRERLWELLMLALYRAGRQADALATYRRVHALFAGELGLEPSDRLKELQRRILVGDADPTSPTTTDDVLLRASLLLPVDRPARVRSLVDYSVGLRRLGEIERADVVLATAKLLADEEEDESARRLIALRLADASTQERGASLRSALRESRRAAAAFESLGDHASRAAALRTEGRVLRDLGRARAALATFEASIEAALAAGDRWQEGMSRNFLATVLLYGPTPVTEAIGMCERHLGALEWGPPGPVGLWGSLGCLHAMNLDQAMGRRLALRAVDATRAASTPTTHCWALSVLAEIDELVGEIASARDRHRAIVEILDSVGADGALAYHSAELARMLAPDEPEEAEELVRRSRTRAAADDFVSQVAWRRALARLSNADEGRALAMEAAEIATRTDFLDLRGRTLEDLAAHQRDEPARRTLQRALRAFHRKGNRLAAARVRGVLSRRRR